MSEHIDWQAYEDGSLPLEERAQADRLLAQDPSARKELEGLRAFRKELKATLAEAQPTLPSLEAKLAAVAKRDGLRFKIVSSASVLAAAALALFYLALHDPLRLDTLPTRAKIKTGDLAYAKEWVRETSGIEAPAPDVRSIAKLFMARHGDGWACYDYKMNGQTYYIYVRKKTHAFEGADSKLVNGKTFYFGRGIGWEDGLYSYYVRGGLEEDRWKVAEAAAESTEAALGT